MHRLTPASGEFQQTLREYLSQADDHIPVVGGGAVDLQRATHRALQTTHLTGDKLSKLTGISTQQLLNFYARPTCQSLDMVEMLNLYSVLLHFSAR